MRLSINLPVFSVQPRPAVYGAQYPPLQHAAAAAALSSPSRQPKNKQANKLQDYENRFHIKLFPIVTVFSWLFIPNFATISLVLHTW